MPSPFPGMDPYLEHPGLWRDVHVRLMTALADDLGRTLPGECYAAIKERIYLADADARAEVAVGSAARRQGSPVALAVGAVMVEVPDQVREIWLEIRSAEAGEVVTVVELLSPTNKRPGKGRQGYEEKRFATLGTRTHLVEIDLLRGGAPMTTVSRRSISAR